MAEENKLLQEKESPKKPSGCEGNLFISDAGGKGINIDGALIPKDVAEEKHLEYASQKVFGTERLNVLVEILVSAASAIPGFSEVMARNLIFSTLQDLEPKDLIEDKLCTSEAVLFRTAMTCLKRAEKEDRMPQAEYFMKNAIKLLRLHNETVEALSRYRRGGEQKMVVQHVNVNGGQAAVMAGNFQSRGGVNGKPGS